MRMILKIFVWPVALLLGMLCFLGTVAYKAASYVISPLLLLGLGCCIYCAVQARWTELAIFAVTVLGLFLGFRYRFSGPDLEREDINSVMGSVADTASELSRQVMDELKLQHEKHDKNKNQDGEQP